MRAQRRYEYTRQNRAPTASAAAAPPIALERRVTAATHVARLQRLAGNRATTRLLQRTNGHAPPDAATPAAPVDGGSQSSQAPPVDPARQAQLLRAATTLQRVEPLAPGDETLLQQAIPAAPLMKQMQERDAKRRELAERTQALQAARDSLASPPEHGVPATQEEVDALGHEVDGLNGEVERLDALVREGLALLGLSSEAELTELLTERFPALFLERAKQIALSELASNRRMVEQETHRYGLDSCVDPAARQALRAAAADLIEHDRAIRELEAELQQARSGTDPPPGGVPDPANAGSSQYDVTRLAHRLEEAGRAREDLRKRYAVQHPILLRQVDLGAIASGDDARFDEAVGGPLRGIAENIDATVENVTSGRLKPWNLNDIVALAGQDLGVTGNPVLEEVVRQHIAREQGDEEMVNAAITALALTAALIATLATGGVALAAVVVDLGVGGYRASESVQSFLAEGAAGNVALDPAVADISSKEPELGWLIADLVGVGMSAAQVVSAVNQLRRAAAAARETGAVVEFIDEARRALPQKAADRVVESVSRQSGSAGPAGALEMRLSQAQYRRALGHVFPAQYLDPVLPFVERAGQRAALRAVANARFVQACRERNWRLAGTLFHSAAATEARALAPALKRLGSGWTLEAEKTLKAGRGGSRADILLTGPEGEIVEVDWKTTGLSASSAKAEEQLARHAEAISTNMTGPVIAQSSKSWVDFVRPLLRDVAWPR